MNENNSNAVTCRENCSQYTICCNRNAICFLIRMIKCLFIDKSIFKYFIIIYYEFGKIKLQVNQ